MKNKEMLYISSITVNIWTLYWSTAVFPLQELGVVHLDGPSPRGFTSSNLPCHHSCFIHAHAVPNGWRWGPSQLFAKTDFLSDTHAEENAKTAETLWAIWIRHSFETVWGYGPAIALRSSGLWARRSLETLWTMGQNSHSSLWAMGKT